MSQLRPAGLGPIVGHVTHEGARVWIRAGDPDDEGASIARHRRTLGVAAICEKGKRFTRGRVHYFRLQREYDRTGTFTFGFETGLGDDEPSAKLTPDTEYQVRVGTLTVDDPDPDGESIGSELLAERLPKASVWVGDLGKLPDEQSLATFCTAPDPAAAPGDLAFLLGSCRYPGLLWKAKQADQIFGPMYDEAMGRDGRPPVRLALMVGDQIYADRMNRLDFGRANTFEEFQERYHTAFGSQNMRKLLSSVPTYMILDDHEIEDNWSQDRIQKAEGRHVFNLAINAYMSYQWLHGPRNYGKHLFYDFVCGGYPFFVLDTRTHRFLDDRSGDLADNHLLGRPSLSPDNEPSQLDALLLCLKREQDARGNVPKFIVSASVFAPNPIDAREGRLAKSPEHAVKWKEDSDSWPAFPTTRRALLQSIVLNEIQNVVFLSGDIHVSNVAQLAFSGSAKAAALRAFSITSSAFYWPFPFADGEPSGYVHDSKAPGQQDTFDVGGGVKLDYRAWNFTQEDNFCRIDIDRANHRLVVVPYDDKGIQIEAGGYFGLGARPLEARLELAAW